MSNQVPNHYADALYTAQAKNYRQSAPGYIPSYRVASAPSHASSSRAAPVGAHLYARRAEVPLGRMSLNAYAPAGYHQPTFDIHQAAVTAPSSDGATFGLFGGLSPYTFDETAFSGTATQPTHIPAADSFEESELGGVVSSISRRRRAMTNEAGPSDSRHGPATSKTKRVQAEATAVAAVTKPKPKRGSLGAKSGRAAQQPSSAHEVEDTTGNRQHQLSTASHQASQSTVVLPPAPPVSDEYLAAFQVASMSPEEAAALEALFEAPQDEAAGPFPRDALGFLTLELPAEPEVDWSGEADQPALDVASPDQEEGSGSIEGATLGLPTQDARPEADSKSAAVPTPGEAVASPANGTNSHSNNNILTETTGRKPRPKRARAVALEKLRKSSPTRSVIAADIEVFKTACRTSKRAAIGALPVYIERYRPDIEAGMANAPVAPTDLNTRQRSDTAQPCILCGAPISGRGYKESAKHRTTCQVMAALVEEDCVVAYLDAKEVDLSWKALRQVTPKFTLPRKPGVAAVRQDWTGDIWGKVRAAMAKEITEILATGRVVQRVAIDLTEEGPETNAVAGPSKRRRDDEDDASLAGPSSKRTYFGAS